MRSNLTFNVLTFNIWRLKPQPLPVSFLPPLYLSAETKTTKALCHQAYSFQKKNAINFAFSAELPIFVAVRKHFRPLQQDANPMIQRQVVFFLFQARHEKNANFRVHSMVVKLQVIIFARKFYFSILIVNKLWQ